MPDAADGRSTDAADGRNAGSAARRSEWAARVFVTVLGGVHVAAAYLPDWLDPRQYDGDHTQHVWWTARFADPELFSGDFIADFFSQPIFAPLGWQALLRFGVQHLDPQQAAETIPLVLGPLLFWLAWRVGRRVGEGWVGGVAAALVATSLSSSLEGGMPRSFALPILLLGLLGLLEARLVWLGVAGLAAALFYPPIAINLGLTAGVVLGVGLLRERRLPAGWPALAALGTLALFVVLQIYTTPLPEEVGPKLTGAEAAAMEEFGPEGRSRLFGENAIDTYLGRGRGGYGVGPAVSLAVALLVLISARALPGLLPMTAWALIGTAMLAHAAAWATLFTLHLPVKYMRYALPAFVLLWLAALAPRLAAGAAARFPALARPRVVGAMAVAFLLVDGGATLHGMREQIDRPDYRDRTRMYRFLTTLPKDALIAAHPEDANAIPLISKRSVLASKEVALPYYRGYYEQVSERLEASLRAHYALDWETVDLLYDRYGVDAIVVHDHRYLPESRKFAEPFESRLGDALHAPREQYVLVQPPSDRLLHHRGPFWVVRLGPARPGYPAKRGRNRLIPRAPAAAGTR